MIATLQQRPKRLYPVSVGHAVHVFADAVFHGFMLKCHALIAFVVIGVDGRALRGMIADKTLKRLSVPCCPQRRRSRAWTRDPSLRRL